MTGEAPAVCEWGRGDQLLACQPDLGHAQLCAACGCLCGYHSCLTGGCVLRDSSAGHSKPTGMYLEVYFYTI